MTSAKKETFFSCTEFSLLLRSLQDIPFVRGHVSCKTGGFLFHRFDELSDLQGIRYSIYFEHSDGTSVTFHSPGRTITTVSFEGSFHFVTPDFVRSLGIDDFTFESFRRTDSTDYPLPPRQGEKK
jgi:hypothetical protein